jgi:hypothetical protein
MASENCALDSCGNLKDAKDIVWYDSGGDNTPIPPAASKSKARPGVPGMFFKFIRSYVQLEV